MTPPTGTDAIVGVDTVTVIDPDQAGASPRALRRQDGTLKLGDPVGVGTVTADEALYVSPGWVDMHAHVYDGVTQISVHADRVGLDNGVHVLADAGSAGQATVRGLVDYVLPRAETTVRVWLNIGSHGLVHLREVADPTFVDVDATLAAIAAHRDLICGIKVRSSGLIVGAMGVQPVQLAHLAAREAGLPLMVHIGEAPPRIADVLDVLDAGDVVTHCFHGKVGHPWQPDGTPSPALRRALDRGVLLDVGHGAASFDVGVARAAVAAGIAPHSISTDIHVRNIHGPVFDLATVMTKMLDCGMPLSDVIRCVTVSPRRTIGAEEPWLTPDGTIRHATVFRLATHAPASRRYVDAKGASREPTSHVVPVATIRDGVARAVA
jgi:dihydroorotase